MGMFKTQTKEVTIEHDSEEHTYEIKPLKGKHISLLYDIASAFSGLDPEEDEEEFQKRFTGEKAEIAHRLVFETLRRSYPDADEEKLDMFASQHMFEFVEPIVQLNQNQQAQQ